MHILTTAPDLDLRALPDIARDPSPAGRAKLFAFLVTLLAMRWDRLAEGERGQLAGLLAVLWRRGKLIDHLRLAAFFASRADAPSVLQPLFAGLKLGGDKMAASHVPVSTPAAAPAGTTPESGGKKKISVTVEVPKGVMQRVRAAPVAPIHVLEAGEKQAMMSASPPSTMAETHKPTPVHDDQSNIPVRVPNPSRALSPDDGGDLHKPPVAEIVAPDLSRAAEPAATPLPATPLEPVAETPNHGRPVRTSEILLSSLLLQQVTPPAQAQPADIEPLLAPRENPHRLTTQLLNDILASGDQARFEVMLASLAGVRAPLLRRILRDSGDEAFAILARSIGMDQAAFAAQWQIWQQGQVELGRMPVPADRKRRKRIGAFFAALTEHQISRLVRRWRGSDSGVFTASAVSS